MLDIGGDAYRVIALPFGPVVAGSQLVSIGGYLVGWAVEETTGAAVARLVLRDGGNAAGLSLVPVDLAAGESARDWPYPGAVPVRTGVYLDVTAGSVAGTVYLATDATYLGG